MENAPDTQTQLVTTAVHILLARAVHPGRPPHLAAQHVPVITDIYAKDIPTIVIILVRVMALPVQFSD